MNGLDILAIPFVALLAFGAWKAFEYLAKASGAW